MIFCGFLVACASQGMPPGGPVDITAPQVLSVAPDTGQINVKDKQAVFTFDEVVSERSPGATTLADLFLVSPRSGTPDVSWSRTKIRVKPPKGWVPNTTYTVTLLPGLADLRGNVRNVPVSTFFSTGPLLANGRISGTVIDWLAAKPIKNAVVEARAVTDTAVAWIALTDSAGSFALRHVPAGQYSVRAYSDQNHNLAIDPGEPWDSATATPGDSAALQLLVFLRDSVAPALDQISATDSVTLIVAFDRVADSSSAVDPANYSITGPDSSRYPIIAVRPPPRDSLQRTMKMARAMPLRSIVIRLGRQLLPNVAYRVRASGVLGVNGKTAPSEKTLKFSKFTPVTPPKRVPAPPPGGAVPIPPPAPNETPLLENE